MQQLKDRFRPLLAAISPSQRVVILAAIGVFGIVAFVFYGWLTTPSYSILYTNLDDASLAKVINQLNTLKAPYKLNGSQVMVPMSDLYLDRAKLASAGVGGQAVPPGWELFDSQSITASSFTQQVDYQRALEGELDKTLVTLAGVQGATVNLAIPQETVFTSNQPAPTASVVLDTTQPLPASEVHTVVFIVSSAVQGLTGNNVTVADSSGNVLAAPGQGGVGATADDQAAQTEAVDASLTSDVQHLVTTATGKAGAVVVRAVLNFNQQTTQVQTYNPATTVPATQATSTETLTGSPSAVAGVVGVTGGLPTSSTSTATSYAKSDNTVTYNAGQEVTSTTVAPGQVEKMSVGIVVDDGTKTHTPAPDTTKLTQLVSAALGLDTGRGDTINVTAVPFPANAAKPAVTAPSGQGLTSLVTQVAAAAVLVIVAFFLLLMARGRRKLRGDPLEIAAVARQAMGPAGAAGLATGEHRGMLGSASGNLPAVVSPRQDVMDLVTRQPEEIAVVLRSWLADRRTGE